MLTMIEEISFHVKTNYSSFPCLGDMCCPIFYLWKKTILSDFNKKLFLLIKVHTYGFLSVNINLKSDFESKC